MTKHREEPVHKLEAVQTNSLYALGFISQISEDLEDRFAYFS